jgi:uncharacterized protein
MIDTIRIRNLSTADIPDILAINSGALPGVSRLDTATASVLLSTATIAWLAVLGERVAGYLIGFLHTSSYDGEEFIWFKQRGGRFIYVDQIAVAASFRGLGIGRRLYAELARWSADDAGLAMVCEVNAEPPNPGSLAFHKTCGFSEVGRLVVADGRKIVLLACTSDQGGTESWPLPAECHY